MKMKSYLLAAAVIAFGLSSCKKENTTPTSGTTTPGPVMVSTPNTAVFTIDSTKMTIKEGTNSYFAYTGYAYSMGLDPDSADVNLYWVIQNGISGDPRIQFTFLDYISTSDFLNDQEKYYPKIFTVGDHCLDYTFSCPSSVFQVFYTDENGVSFSSMNIMQPADAFAKITSSAIKTDSNGKKTQHIKGNFKCRLADWGGIGIKEITDGAFYYVFSKN